MKMAEECTNDLVEVCLQEVNEFLEHVLASDPLELA